MAYREKGPLEREVFAAFEHATKANPTIHGLAQGRLSPDDLKALRVNEKLTINELNARVFGAGRKSLERLAREVDALKASLDGGD
jgi:hypothetical protein